MAIPAGVVRFNIVGTAPGGEIWNTGFYTHGAAPDNDSDLQALLDVVYPAYDGHLRTKLQDLTSTDVLQTELRAYSYPGGGPRAAAIATHPVPAGNQAGASNANNALGQCIVVSLLTNSAGRQSRGRMYFPATGITPGPGHVFGAADVTNLANSMQDFIQTVNPLAGGLDVVVASSVGNKVTKVKRIAVDNRPDFQRRRANRQHATQIVTKSIGN